MVRKKTSPLRRQGGGSCAVELVLLDGAAEFAQEGADGWSEDDQASDGQDRHEGDDQTVFDQTLSTIAGNGGKGSKHWRNSLSCGRKW